MKNIYLLGATGSIGTQTIEVLRTLDESYRLVSICFGSKLEEAIKIIDEFNLQHPFSEYFMQAYFIELFAEISRNHHNKNNENK